MSEAQRQDVINRLRKYRDQLQGLMNLIGDQTRLSGEQRARAQGEMRALKEALNADDKYGSSVKGQAEMNSYERAYLFPAVHGASSRIRARWNSDPIGSDWFSGLYAAMSISGMPWTSSRASPPSNKPIGGSATGEPRVEADSSGRGALLRSEEDSLYRPAPRGRSGFEAVGRQTEGA